MVVAGLVGVWLGGSRLAGAGLAGAGLAGTVLVGGTRPVLRGGVGWVGSAVPGVVDAWGLMSWLARRRATAGCAVCEVAPDAHIAVSIFCMDCIVFNVRNSIVSGASFVIFAAYCSGLVSRLRIVLRWVMKT